MTQPTYPAYPNTGATPAPAPEEPAAQSGPVNITVSLEPDVAKGSYVNFFQVRFTPVELVFDFGRMIPDLNHLDITTRLLMHPAQGRLLMRAIHEAVTAYEMQFKSPVLPLEGPALASQESAQIGFRTSEDLRREGYEIARPRPIVLPSDPSRPEDRARSGGT